MARRRSYQRGTLFQRGKEGNEVWIGRWRLKVIRANGSRGSKQLSQVLGRVAEMSERKAHKELELRLRPFNEGQQRPQQQITFDQFVHKHWEPTVRPSIRETTLGNYWKALRKHILPVFGNLKLADISRAEIYRFLSEKLTLGISPNHTHVIRTTLSKVLTLAVELEFVERNPMRDLKLPGRRNLKETSVLSKAHTDLLSTALPEPCQTYFQFDNLTGLRPGEQFGLAWKDVDFARKIIHVNRTYNPDYKKFYYPKTQTSIRKLSMSSKVEQLLKAHRQRFGQNASPESLVFSEDGSAINWHKKLTAKYIKPMCRALGLPEVTWHSFRHSAGTNLHDSGASAGTVQRILGHASTKITDKYIHSVPESERAAMDRHSEQMFSNCSQVEKHTDGSEHLPN